jgi:hypothetical protein
MSQILTRKSDQPMVYAFRFLNRVKQNYCIIERGALIMFFAFHKFKHYCWVISLSFMLIIWHWSICSTNHGFHG